MDTLLRLCKPPDSTILGDYSVIHHRLRTHLKMHRAVTNLANRLANQHLHLLALGWSDGQN